MIRSVADIRQAFLDYFAKQGHTIVASSPLVPGNDATLLFTNAGMVQFKETFLGHESRPYVRATTAQRCVRAGGKHNDLDNVGYTARHHTFFEMLGNFSFGDYFKREAIEYAWDFLTRVLQLPPEKLWVTVYEEDDEAADLWLKHIKVDPQRFSRCGKKDNFWMMGDTGPCGPCSEIFYDHGEAVFGGPPGSPDEDGDRYIEIWNLVFMQYNRNASGQLTPLPRPSVDTGMGLERLSAVLQKVHSNYEIDLFQHLLAAVGELAGTSDYTNSSMRVIADHIRACAFLIVDGVVPSNEGRGYVLRRIIRRAIRHGHKLGLREPFFHQLVDALDREMGEAYPELRASKDVARKVLLQEEQRFADTLDQGMKVFEQAIGELTGTEIPGELIFRLYDTYGFPTDLTGDIARERGLRLDMDGFEAQMSAQRARARAASQFTADWSQNQAQSDLQSEFKGYETAQIQAAVVAMYENGNAVEQITAGQKAQVILNDTPFYAESGGQVGDRGELQLAHGGCFVVEDTQKMGKAIVHIGELTQGILRVGDRVTAHIDESARTAIARHHSATHLLHAALRKQLGEHVKQKGSLVNADRLRFDFSHFEPVSPDQLRALEYAVNQQILSNYPVETELMALEHAMNSGAMALFGEKYEEQVRVLRMGQFSTELCGGTHVKRVGDIGLFKIVSETGVAAGVRRIEAIAGLNALQWVNHTEHCLTQAAQLLRTVPDELEARIKQLQEQVRQQEKMLEKMQAKLASNRGQDLLSESCELAAGIRLLVAELESLDAKQLRDTLDQVKSKLDQSDGVILLASIKDAKVSLIAGVTKGLMNKVKAGDLVNFVAQQVGGRGGGRPDMAQAGGTQPENLASALASVAAWVKERL
ncbi:alanine--tRNA ligase [Thioflexithrix psekupsensis]|uniref:Alanine--tRNA ligase n=1 Tax=Thioflexithrix psekupsensis TaxID=1570016 RepID=A0A251XAY7_9GAMM|nr:alanine--tRNA ligase [Thioflexithrix psekupsensis]OUD15236.1 alanine--tRNA ligase [Thioflexithrix psekupsensis]